MFGLIKGAGKLAIAPAVGASKVAYGAARAGVSSTISQGMGSGGMAVANESMRFLSGKDSGTTKAAKDIVDSNKQASAKPEVASSNKILNNVVKALSGIHEALREIEINTRMNSQTSLKMFNLWRDMKGESYQRARARLKPIVNPLANVVGKEDEKEDGDGKRKGGLFSGIMNFGKGMLSWFKGGGWKSVFGIGAIGLIALMAKGFKDFVEEKLGKKFTDMTPSEIWDAAKEYFKTEIVGPDSTLGKALGGFLGFLNMFSEVDEETGERKAKWGNISLGAAALSALLLPFIGIKAALLSAAVFGIIGIYNKLKDWFEGLLESVGIDPDESIIDETAAVVGTAGLTYAGVKGYQKIKSSLAGTPKVENPKPKPKPKVPKPSLASKLKPGAQRVASLAQSGAQKVAQTATAGANVAKSAAQRTAEAIKQISKQFPNFGKVFNFLKSVPKGGPIAAALAAPEIVMALTNDELSRDDKIKAIAGPIGGIVGMMSALAATATATFPGPGWLASLLIGGAGYFGGNYIAKKAAGWMLGGNEEVPVGEQGYPIDQEMIRKKNARGQPTSQMIPNPDYIPPPSEASLSGNVNTPGGALTMEDGTGGAATIIYNNYYGGNTQQVNQSDTSTNIGGGGGTSQNSGSYGKLKSIPFANALVG